MPKAGPSSSQAAQLAVPDVPAIVKTKATQQYRLGASDLDSILPLQRIRRPVSGMNVDGKKLTSIISAMSSRSVLQRCQRPLELTVPASAPTVAGVSTNPGTPTTCSRCANTGTRDRRPCARRPAIQFEVEEDYMEEPNPFAA
ncbi:hypothetical protein B0H19DRAFT_1084807 [Mycena capillaripes]|nr:hypothetical protein B0H19DRAFT_1084807 [Mycena capillaripes]